ncbi:FAD-dependent oxidoreductase [Fontimonas sp. SYSU GA230001]|uniref:NAD(P)/FAD-dependent oxidoreductase n=1 Tax=Fontimonas sp. SYSU GA230001 TaxID=3142450 RepID=UPI0032B3C940
MTEAALRTVIIVGGGQAGGEAAAELRKLGFDGRVLIVGEEPFLPYKRPPLSKAYLAGAVGEESLYMMQQASLDKARIEYRGGARVARIDRVARQVELADGSRIGYDKLVLATGGRARPIPVPGADRPNVFMLRTIADVQAIRARCGEGRRVTIVGGGFIGLEAAAVLVKHGLKVTVLEGLPRVLARVTCPEVSVFYERVHRETGVDLRTGVAVAAFEGEPDVTRVRLADGGHVDTDLVIVGIGVIPNVELAQDAGLTVDNGIVVDEHARTADPDIYAAGDCTNHPSAFLGRRVRLESVQNAMEQARAAARNLLGKTESYQMVPWFWSDQYDLKLQMVGISTGYDRVVLRGDPATQRNFAVFYLDKAGHLIAADTVTRPQDFMFAKKLVAAKAVIDPAQLADETVALKTLVSS